MTLYFEPRYFSIVFALDGDSTITNVSAIILLRPFGRLQLIYSKIRFCRTAAAVQQQLFFTRSELFKLFLIGFAILPVIRLTDQLNV